MVQGEAVPALAKNARTGHPVPEWERAKKGGPPANNNFGGANPTLPSSPDSLTPTFNPTLKFYSQPVGTQPWNAKFEGSVPLGQESNPEMALIPPQVYVSAAYGKCMRDHGY
jgi:hypothetical protein